LFIRAEKVRSIRIVHEFEPVSARINVLICDDTITNGVEISFNFCLL
jgi:hypothetical protein